MFRKNILEMSSYKPPIEGRSSGDYLLLDFNERVTPVSGKVKQAISDFLDKDVLQKYPEYGDFPEKLASYMQVNADELMITNGSDQGIEIIFKAVCEKGDQVIAPVPSFAMFFQSAAVEGVEVVSPVYSRENGYPLQEVLSAVNEKTKLIVICTPNNPTGTEVEPAQILEVAKAAPNTAILVDECYFEYSKKTVKDYVKDYKNLFITRTFSKTWGLSALRLGYIISSASNIEQLTKIRGPYDMNVPAIVAANAALDDPSYVEDYVKEVMEVSKPALENFLSKRGIKYWPSAANFVLFEVEDQMKVVKSLEQKGILIRPRSGPGIDNTVRISLAPMKEMKRLLAALGEIL